MRTITVKVIPNASQNKLIKTDEDSFKVYVTAKPVGGEANRALLKLLSKELKVPKSSMSIIIGKTAREKVIQII